LTNTSGAAYPEATVKLVAGEVNRISEDLELDILSANNLVKLSAQPQVEQRDFFEYQLYEIVRPVTVGRNETKQVEFVGGAGIPATTYYVFKVPLSLFSKQPISERYAGTARTGSIRIYLEFSTGKENGLGADLPAGRVRVYQEDIDGAALLIGENRIGHTPEGEVVSLYLGNAFDLVGERSQTRFNLIANNILEETYEIRLRNRKDDLTVEIRVPETLFRWSNWRILESSLPFKQLDANTIEFRASVPPGGKTVITYTVRYTLP
ncbi:MAG: DUF4139 domain-containing protein, partial [Candidatus Flexifilum sp.]